MQKTQRPGTLRNKIYTVRDHFYRPRNMPTAQSGPGRSTVCQIVQGTSPRRHSACKEPYPGAPQSGPRAPVLPLSDHDRICAVVLNSLPPQQEPHVVFFITEFKHTFAEIPPIIHDVVKIINAPIKTRFPPLINTRCHHTDHIPTVVHDHLIKNMVRSCGRLKYHRWSQ